VNLLVLDRLGGVFVSVNVDAGFSQDTSAVIRDDKGNFLAVLMNPLILLLM
jgi:hypothetical protein